eukprot:symbB.v1.2.032698.t1/scaffold3951.1/size47625/1
MAYGILGPQNSWLQSPQAQCAANRLNIAPSTLALKWAEHKGFLTLVRELKDLFEAEVPVEQRSFMRLYRAAPSVETCTTLLCGNVIPEAPTPRAERTPSPEKLPFKDSIRRTPREVKQAPVKHQALPDLIKRSQQGRAGLVWQGEVATKRLPGMSPRIWTDGVSKQIPGMSPCSSPREEEDFLVEAAVKLLLQIALEWQTMSCHGVRATRNPMCGISVL